MWKILGKEALYLDIAPTWKERMLELAGDDDKAKKFKEILSASEVTSLFNASSLEHAFFIRVDDAVSPEDIQTCADAVLDILKSIDFPVVNVAISESAAKEYRVVLNAVAPVPHRCYAAEAVLNGKDITPELAEEAAAAAVADAEPFEANKYKIQIAKTLIKRTLLAM